MKNRTAVAFAALLVCASTSATECGQEFDELKRPEGEPFSLGYYDRGIWALASAVLFGRSIKTELRKNSVGQDQYYADFEILKSFKGALSGRVELEFYPGINQHISVGYSYVLVLFDDYEFDPCSPVFTLPHIVDSEADLAEYLIYDWSHLGADRQEGIQRFKEFMKYAPLSP